MRRLVRVRWRGFACLAILVSVVCAAHAATPVPPWLKPYLADSGSSWMPDAPAILLVDSGEVQFTSADRAKRTYRAAIKVRTAKGRDEARTSVVYNTDTDRIVSARAWTVSADGKNVTAFAKQAFLDALAEYDSRIWNAQRRLVFDGSDKVAPGGVVAWEIQLESQAGIFDLDWSFRDDRPVLHSVFEVVPPAARSLSWFASSSLVPEPAAVSGGAAGAMRWSMERITPVAGRRPDGFIATPLGVSVRCADSGGTKQTWADVAGLVADVIEPRIEISPDVALRAKTLVAGKTTRWECIRALCEFAQNDISYLAVTLDKDTLAGYRPRPASEVLSCRYGDCKDKATLLVAMLRAIGEKGNVLLVNAMNPKAVTPEWPSASFNHAIVVMPADDTPAGWPVSSAGTLGPQVVFDPTDSATPLGALPVGVQGGWGLVAAREGGALIAMPVMQPAFTGVERVIAAEIGEQGELAAHVEETACGNHAVVMRAFRLNLRDERFARALERRLNDVFSAVQDVKWSAEWDKSACRDRLTFDFKTMRHARQTGASMMLFVPQMIPTKPEFDTWLTEAEGESWLPADRVHEETRIKLPSGYEAGDFPREWTVDLPQISMRLSYRAEDGAVIFTTELNRSAGFFDRRGYETLRQQYQRMGEAQRRPVVIRRKPAGDA